MDIKKIRNKWICYAPGRKRIPGEYQLKGQAIAAYYNYMNILKNQLLSTEPEHTSAESIATPIEDTPIELYVNPALAGITILPEEAPVKNDVVNSSLEDTRAKAPLKNNPNVKKPKRT